MPNFSGIWTQSQVDELAGSNSWPARPGTPTIGTATSWDSSAYVAFTPSERIGYPTNRTYTATSSPGGFSASGSSSPIQVTGLTNGVSYTFTVTASNSTGTSAPSASSNSVVPAIVLPGAPTSVTATAGFASASVAFTAPTQTGSGTITGYSVLSDPGGITASGASSPVTVTGLTNGTSYTFTVKAVSTVGDGPYSDPSNSVTPNDVTRGIIAGGTNASYTQINTIQYITVATLGDSSDFGDLYAGTNTLLSGTASSTRGIFFAGSNTSVIQYVTIATTGNSANFGSTVNWASTTFYTASFGNETRGVVGGGYVGSNTSNMSYVTIATTGTFSTFGNLSQPLRALMGCASSTRGVVIGGLNNSSTRINDISYWTIATGGGSSDFGDAINPVILGSACSNSTRGLVFGGYSGPVNVIQYITIASTGNATDFGDLNSIIAENMAVSSPVRAVSCGGVAGSNPVNVMEYVTIASAGNATDFGDLYVAQASGAGISNGHGGVA